MGKITLDIVLKVAEVVTNIIIVVADTLKGRKQHDNSGSSQTK